MLFSYQQITLDTFHTSWLPEGLEAALLRLDQLHPAISGNKWFKLKYNLAAAKAAGATRIVTFGGAYSNHIAATAVACKMAGFAATGIIRGEQPAIPGHTLQQAAAHGMELVFVSREDYKNKYDPSQWYYHQADTLVIPEGGHNAAGAQGCEEILTIHPTAGYTHILCAAGTGTTLAGLINQAAPSQQVIGIPVLKGAQFLEKDISDLLRPDHTAQWRLLYDHHGGGYAKISPGLIDFINTFYQETGIPTDIIYTGKLLLAFRELVQQGYFPDNSRVLLIHTGGLQGNLSLAPGTLAF
ncbi:1-aminocyclopropane-1-carboxylate deaminase/D-cysteine desulfhydrase [Chitinophaga nivalis]|uniref:Pyridoxal-phosphate dependent enzyme n=1 Tax=Chitinophaga nivalis TaxID=2991709 RepID=A0ABT3IFU3_9BACT|nr:pyridoxal-phosphate dependent enzyme [Chitinophaga nivalis]MCW3467487.1 pyridoxal-phosphate dependent enzyme [Chitinophaga nivalis]MCW3482821.1 pyridoxal-phosphate dependent enzyme [Chitinophaga nivalis]